MTRRVHGDLMAYITLNRYLKNKLDGYWWKVIESCVHQCTKYTSQIISASLGHCRNPWKNWQKQQQIQRDHTDSNKIIKIFSNNKDIPTQIQRDNATLSIPQRNLVFLTEFDSQLCSTKVFFEIYVEDTLHKYGQDEFFYPQNKVLKETNVNEKCHVSTRQTIHPNFQCYAGKQKNYLKTRRKEVQTMLILETWSHNLGISTA